MKTYAILVALVTNQGDLGIATFLNMSMSFVFKVRKQLSDFHGDAASVTKEKKASPAVGRRRDGQVSPAGAGYCE